MQKSRKRTFLAFFPAMVAIGITAFAASGVSVVTGATAASSVPVGGEVSTTFSTTPTLDNSGTVSLDCDDEVLTTFASAASVTNGCQIGFSSNHVGGAVITFQNANPNTDAAFFCSDGDDAGGVGTRSCATDAGRLEDVAGTGQTITTDSDRFGLALRAVGGGAAADTGVSGVDGTPLAGDPSWNQIPANGSAARLCQATGPSAASTCDIVFAGAGEGTAGQGSGDYSGTLTVTAALD